jgi:hypothetical protein
LRRRVATASRYISDFGVAMYCGFGRQPGRDGTQTMREHAHVVRSIRSRSDERRRTPIEDELHRERGEEL